MLEKGILFSPQMMRMVYQGKKLQTRRVMPVQPSADGMELGKLLGTTGNPRNVGKFVWGHTDAYEDDGVFFSRPYDVGDVLVPRSTWAVLPELDHLRPLELDPEGLTAFWMAGRTEKPSWAGRSRPGRFLPRSLWGFVDMRLKVLDIRVERVQDISAVDAMWEGIESAHDPLNRKTIEKLGNESGTGRACIQEFHELWDSINKKRGYGWKENLYNWVYDFNPTWLVWGDTSL